VTAFADRHAGVQHFEHLFVSGHLPPHLAAVSDPFRDLAEAMLQHLTVDGPELTTGLRKLWEAKNSFVAHAVLTQPAEEQDRMDG